MGRAGGADAGGWGATVGERAGSHPVVVWVVSAGRLGSGVIVSGLAVACGRVGDQGGIGVRVGKAYVL
jgi:hypothetical protein